MKLTKRDKETLLAFGHPEKDFKQIQQATLKRNTIYELEGNKISLEELLQLMDRREYLSGISRSAFHYSAVRHTKDGREVYFNSSRLFE